MNNEKDLEIEAIDGVKSIERCMFVPCSSYLPEKNETKSSQIFTFDLRKDFYKPKKESESRYSKNMANVWVESSFAKLNGY